MAKPTEDIRGVLIETVGGRILLPNATVSEVITLSEPAAVEDAPNWLLGRVPWRGWRVPLISFGVYSGLSGREPQDTARVCILKAIGEHRRLPFIALLAQGFPRLATLRPDIVVPMGGEDDMPHGVLAHVNVNDDSAWIPAMMTIEDDVADVLGMGNALPTQN